MSAYVVNNETINCITNGLIEWGFIDISDAVKVGQMLFDENVTSVNYRYREKDFAPVFKFTPKQYEELDYYGCVKCWQYQTCEYDNCEDGEGWKLTDKLLSVYPSSFSDMDYAWGL